jgi:hypothetical protein
MVEKGDGKAVVGEARRATGVARGIGSRIDRRIDRFGIDRFGIDRLGSATDQRPSTWSGSDRR